MFKHSFCFFSLVVICTYCFSQQPKDGSAGGKNNSVILERYSVASKTSNIKSGPSEKWYHGVKIISCEYLDGKKNGLWKSQSVDGRIFYQGNYSNDKKNGAWKYYLNQKRLCITYFKDGKKDSTWQSFYPNGKTQCIKTYSNDVQVGPMKLFFENGNIKKEMTYVDDYIDGKYTSYYANGVLQSEIEYKYDNPYNVLKMNDSLGNAIDFGTLKDGTGTFIEYSSNQKKRSLTSYKNGHKNGIALSYFENGNTYSETLYLEGRKDGASTHFLSNGEVYYSIMYMEGSIIKSNYTDNKNYSLIKKDELEIALLNDQESEISPEFLGGEKEMKNYILASIEYPMAAISHNQQGTVYSNFLVNEDGSLSDIHISEGVSEELDTEAIRVMSQMPPWIPGFEFGLPTAVRYNYPITFKLIK